MRRIQIVSFLLVVPALGLVLVSVAWPLAAIMKSAYTNTISPAILPDTNALIRNWQAGTHISDDLVSTLLRELSSAYEARKISRLGSTLENELRGMRKLINKTAAALRNHAPITSQADLIIVVPQWQDEKTWIALQRGLQTYTWTHILRALDFFYDRDGQLQYAGRSLAIFTAATIRTVILSILVTSICAILAYPLAYVMATSSKRWKTVALFCVLFSFWISLLVRTSAWIIILQRQGILNDLLLKVGLLSERIQLINNRTGLLITMVHILLPFMILPLYASMVSISRQQILAGLSLGAGPATVFRRVYLPQTISGLQTGVILVFVITLGFYITPALVGGPGDQMLSSYIASYLNERLDWATASALSFVLILIIILSYFTLYLLFRSHRAIEPK